MDRPQFPGFLALISHSALIRGIGAGYVFAGLYGGLVWLIELEDRADGDSLRWGFHHSPWMQIPPFHTAFLDWSILILCWCAAASIVGGICLLIPFRWGALLTKTASYSAIVIHSVVVFFTLAVIYTVLPIQQWDEWYVGDAPLTLALRTGSILYHLTLCLTLNALLRRPTDLPQ